MAAEPLPEPDPGDPPWRETSSPRTKFATSRDEDAIAALFARQELVARLDQLVALGLSASAVRNRVPNGRLYRIHRGVYSLVPREHLSPHGRWLAAVLACGDGAALARRSGGALWGVTKRGGGKIDVIAPGRRGRMLAGIDAHVASNMVPEDIVTVVQAGPDTRAPVRPRREDDDQAGIPVTSVARTVLDLAGTEDRNELERLLHQATILELIDLGPLGDVMERNPLAPGLATLRDLLQVLKPDPGNLTDEGIERMFLEICRKAGIPEPTVKPRFQLPTGDVVEPDFVWFEQRVIVETDGRGVHDTPQAFQLDRTKGQLLAALGWIVVRFTYEDVAYKQQHVAEIVYALVCAG